MKTLRRAGLYARERRSDRPIFRSGPVRTLPSVPPLPRLLPIAEDERLPLAEPFDPLPSSQN